jgi:hypothetical protein
MHIIFLSARLPLTKTFAVHNKQLVTKPYPLVSRVSSHEAEVNSLQDFYKELVANAKLNRCLFSGHLQHPLVDESRAGKTIRNDRTWVCLDFDKVNAKTHEEVIEKYLPDYCQNVSYIVQPSASMFLPKTKRWSGHIFMMLKTPTPEKALKSWFEHLNFTNKYLAKELVLTDSLQALHWPLDRTVADCTKIIYIAAPICHGFEPSIKSNEAIKLVKKKTNALNIPLHEPVTTNDIRAKINALRKAINQPELDYNISSHNGDDILIGATECDVHNIRTSGDHYIRFNLNGGDSYGYYIDLRNPGLIKNFKGEPFLRTDEAAPELYKTLKKTAPKTVAAAPLDEDTDIFACYATNKSSAIYVGKYEPIERALTLNNASETSAKAWLAEHSISHKGYLPHVSLEFNPHQEMQYVHGSNVVNTFRSTDYMQQTKSTDAVSHLSDIPVTINKTLRSMLGNPDNETLEHFINWLAFIFQTRKKTGAAWVLHGTQGTGKSIFIKHILTPLFGENQVKILQFNLVKTDFNAFLENALFVIFEEADTKSVDNQAALMSKLKHWITDSPIEINSKNIKPYSVPNYANFIFNSNERTPVNSTSDDRRFNFANRQETKLFYTPNELQVMFSGTELPAFADMLLRWPADPIAASKVLHNQAKIDVHEATTSINQLIAEAILRGDLQFFIDRMPSDSEAAADYHNRFNPLGLFKTKIAEYQSAAQKNEPSLLTDEDLFILFRTLITDARYFQDTRTWRKRHYKTIGLDIEKQHRVPGNTTARARGLLIQWNSPEFPAALESKVTPFKERKNG